MTLWVNGVLETSKAWASQTQGQGTLLTTEIAGLEEKLKIPLNPSQRLRSRREHQRLMYFGGLPGVKIGSVDSSMSAFSTAVIPHKHLHPQSCVVLTT